MLWEISSVRGAHQAGSLVGHHRGADSQIGDRGPANFDPGYSLYYHTYLLNTIYCTYYDTYLLNTDCIMMHTCWIQIILWCISISEYRLYYDAYLLNTEIILWCIHAEYRLYYDAYLLNTDCIMMHTCWIQSKVNLVVWVNFKVATTIVANIAIVQPLHTYSKSYHGFVVTFVVRRSYRHHGTQDSQGQLVWCGVQPPLLCWTHDLCLAWHHPRHAQLHLVVASVIRVHKSVLPSVQHAQVLREKVWGLSQG